MLNPPGQSRWAAQFRISCIVSSHSSMCSRFSLGDFLLQLKLNEHIFMCSCVNTAAFSHIFYLINYFGCTEAASGKLAGGQGASHTLLSLRGSNFLLLFGDFYLVLKVDDGWQWGTCGTSVLLPSPSHVTLMSYMTTTWWQGHLQGDV